MLSPAIPVIISILSSVYVPFYSIYKAASSYDNGYGRSDYDDYDDGYGFDSKWDSEFRRRRRGPGKRPRVRLLANLACIYSLYLGLVIAERG